MAASKAIGFLNFKFGADLKGFDRAMKKAQKNLKRFGKNIQRTGENLTTGLTLPILGLGAASLKLASDFEETDTKFKQVFSSIEEKAENTAKSLSDSFGLSNLAAKQLLSDTGDLLVGFGFTEDSALDLSKKVNELAVDLASFTNFAGGSEGASRALTKALVGETESAKALGIVIRQGTKEYKERTAQIMQEQGVTILQAKALNNLEIAVSQSGKAIGDFQRTQDGFANQVRITKGELTDAAVSLGEHLLPMAQKAIGVFRGLVDRFNSLSTSTKESIVKWGLLVATIGPALIIVGKIALGISSLITLFSTLRTAVLATSGAFKALTLAMVKNPIGAVITLATSAAAAYFLLETNTKGATKAQREFNGVTESTEDAIKRLSKSVGDMGKDSLQLQIEEIQKLIYDIKGFEIPAGASPFAPAGLPLTEKQQEQLKQLNGILTKLKTKQAQAKKEADELAKSFENLGEKTEYLGEETENNKKVYKALNIELAHTKKINEELIPKKSTKSFEEITGWVTKLTKEQELMNAGFGMFGDVLTSSLDDALSSQQKFFPIFIANIKKAIQSLLVQLAVMTALSAIMPASLGGKGAKAFSRLNILDNLGKIMGFAEGGLVTGPTVGLIGEGIGTTASNPEVIAPLDKLKNFIGGGSQNVIVEGVIKGNDIFLSNRNTGTNRQRSV